MDNSNLKKCSCELCGKVFENKNPKTSLIKHQILCKDRYTFLEKYKLDENNLENELSKSGSVLQFQVDHPFRDNNSFYYKLFKEYGIETTVKKAANNPNTKNKAKATNLERYGSEHNFCKDHPSRIKWEARLFEEEGITNVFQREEVKQKITQSLLAKYGVEHAAQHPDFKANLDFYIKKFGEIEGKKKYEEVCYKRGNSLRLSYYVELFGEDEGLLKYQERIKKSSNYKRSSVSNLSVIFAKLLDELQIQYEQEFVIQDSIYTRIYDFKINNLLIELNGDYWHANPNKYNADDILHFPGRNVIASNVWKKDEFKKELALLNGFDIIYFWENELTNYKKLKEIKNKINEICKNKIN